MKESYEEDVANHFRLQRRGDCGNNVFLNVRAEGQAGQLWSSEITPRKSLTLKIYTGPRSATGRCVIRVGLDKSDDLKSAQLTVRLNGSARRALEDLPASAKPDPRKGRPQMDRGRRRTPCAQRAELETHLRPLCRVYYLGWQESTKIHGCNRSVFNVDISRDGVSWERKYRFRLAAITAGD